MKKTSTSFLLLRGLSLGLLTAFINGLSLPALISLSIRVMTVLDIGTWPSGPALVAELWVIEFAFGVVSSLFPGVIASVILHLGILDRWNRRTHKKWLRMCIGMTIGGIVAAFYIPLLFYIEPVINFREYSMLAVMIFVEQMTIFSWITARLSTRQKIP